MKYLVNIYKQERFPKSYDVVQHILDNLYCWGHIDEIYAEDFLCDEVKKLNNYIAEKIEELFGSKFLYYPVEENKIIDLEIDFLEEGQREYSDDMLAMYEIIKRLD